MQQKSSILASAVLRGLGELQLHVCPWVCGQTLWLEGSAKATMGKRTVACFCFAFPLLHHSVFVSLSSLFGLFFCVEYWPYIIKYKFLHKFWSHYKSDFAFLFVSFMRKLQNNLRARILNSKNMCFSFKFLCKCIFFLYFSFFNAQSLTIENKRKVDRARLFLQCIVIEIFIQCMPIFHLFLRLHFLLLIVH